MPEGQPSSEKPAHEPAFHLDRMEASDIVALFTALSECDTEPVDRLLNSLDKDFSQLPEQNFETACEAFTLLAQSEVEANRDMVARNITQLLEVEARLGLSDTRSTSIALWVQLLRDEEAEVTYEAEKSLTEAIIEQKLPLRVISRLVGGIVGTMQAIDDGRLPPRLPHSGASPSDALQ